MLSHRNFEVPNDLEEFQELVTSYVGNPMKMDGVKDQDFALNAM